jgi:DNA-binding MarR family transcriptional regulator
MDAFRYDSPLHNTTRFMIVAHLARCGGRASYTDTLAVVKVHSGALSQHIRKLEAAGHLKIKKSFRDRRPHTEMSLTDLGRAALSDHMLALALVAGPAAMMEAASP